MRSDSFLRKQHAVSSELGELRRLGTARRDASAPAQSMARTKSAAAKSDAAAASKPAFVLSADEEVTLRRVAHGQSTVRMMRAADLLRLRRLKLIEDAKDGPRLTTAGKNHFEGLPRGVFVGALRQDDYPASAIEKDRERKR